MERETAFWECNKYQERLHHINRDEAIEAFLDDIKPEKWPEKVYVYGYARIEVDKNLTEPLQHVLEALDEEYGDPEGYPDGPTEAMKEAERKFLEVVLREYKPWACEEVTSEEVDVQAWVREHRPDWLEDEECQT